MPRIATITKSPFAEDSDGESPPPWSWGEIPFIDWVDEVLREGYKRHNPEMTFFESVAFARAWGYTLEIAPALNPKEMTEYTATVEKMFNGEQHVD